MGREANRLIELFNSGLHHSPTKMKMSNAFLDLVSWVSELIEIDTASVRDPYGAYQEEIRKFALEIVAKRPE